jgi:molecular chaperone HscA
VGNPSGWIVAIDFGTAFSKAAAVPCDLPAAEALRRARPLRVGEAAGAGNAHLVPSALFLLDRQVYFGADAAAHAQRSSVGKREALQSFKLLLGTNDLDAFLVTRPSRRIDPDGVFTYRELITLYLAYFLGLVGQAFRDDPTIIEGSVETWRYTRPGWFTERTQRDHILTVELFSNAASVLAALPPQFWRQPFSYDEAKRALAQARPGTINVDAGVFEASAAATAYLPDVVNAAWSMIVIDMGAGTTDFGSYMSVPGPSGKARLHSLDHTIAIAGDDIDRSLLNVIIQKAKGINSQRELGGLWRHMLPSIRARKEEIFSSGQLSIEFYGHTVSCSMRELQKSKDFRAIVEAISKDFASVIDQTAKRAAKYKLREMVVITTGGGARLPFIAEMVRKAAAKRSPVRIRVAPPQPLWINEATFRDEVGPIFDQLAIAIGGAIAPKEMLISAQG